MSWDQEKEAINMLSEFAKRAGATRVRCLLPEKVRVEERLASFCHEPRCPNWGQSMSCPPNVSGSDGFRRLLQETKHVLVFRIEIPSSSLLGEQRTEVMRLLHEIAADIEKEAKRLGFGNAAAFAGGSCKLSFCADYQACQVIADQGKCRYPEYARPSMSGFGVNVGELMKAAGWPSAFGKPDDSENASDFAWVAGLVLLRY